MIKRDFNKFYLCRKANKTRQSIIESPRSGLLLFAQIRINHTHELHNMLLLTTLVVIGGLIRDQERVYLSIVSANRYASTVGVIALHRLD